MNYLSDCLTLFLSNPLGYVTSAGLVMFYGAVAWGLARAFGYILGVHLPEQAREVVVVPVPRAYPLGAARTETL